MNIMEHGSRGPFDLCSSEKIIGCKKWVAITLSRRAEELGANDAAVTAAAYSLLRVSPFIMTIMIA